MKILIVLPRFPYPLEKGDRLRAYHQIRQLSEGNEVFLLALSHQPVGSLQLEALKPYCAQIRVVRLHAVASAWHVLLSFVRLRPLQVGYWSSARARRAFRRFEAEVRPDVVYNQMIRTMGIVGASASPRVMDFQDALSLNLQRRMQQCRGLMRRVLRYEFKAVRSAEYNAFSRFDRLTIISETDAAAIPHKDNGDIVVVPNGVDADYFCAAHTDGGARAAGEGSTLPGTYDLCFVGNMSYAPNVSAARFLVREVMPLVWAGRPQARLLLAGASPLPAVRALASERVTVSGHLPDIRVAYASASLFVAPMLIGSGLQNKILEAMAMGRPCIATPLSATPVLQDRAGEEAMPLLVGATASELAQHITALLADPVRAKALAEAGHAYVRKHFSWKSTTAILEHTLAEAAARGGRH